MAEFTAQDVKALRDATGAGMMDCKKALTEADGDMERAAQVLRQKGLSKVATLEDRENNQGAVAIARNGNVAAMVELKSETDFSAKADDFVALTQALADAVLADGEEAVAAHQAALEDLKISKKENIELGLVARFEAADGNVLDAYLHTQDGRGTNGVLIEISGSPTRSRNCRISCPRSGEAGRRTRGATQPKPQVSSAEAKRCMRC
jgi:elongation factor Ts